jgi:hypothetical protein
MEGVYFYSGCFFKVLSSLRGMEMVVNQRGIKQSQVFCSFGEIFLTKNELTLFYFVPIFELSYLYR